MVRATKALDGLFTGLPARPRCGIPLKTRESAPDIAQHAPLRTGETNAEGTALGIAFARESRKRRPRDVIAMLRLRTSAWCSFR